MGVSVGKSLSLSFINPMMKKEEKLVSTSSTLLSPITLITPLDEPALRMTRPPLPHKPLHRPPIPAPILIHQRTMRRALKLLPPHPPAPLHPGFLSMLPHMPRFHQHIGARVEVQSRYIHTEERAVVQRGSDVGDRVRAVEGKVEQAVQDESEVDENHAPDAQEQDIREREPDGARAGVEFGFAGRAVEGDGVEGCGVALALEEVGERGGAVGAAVGGGVEDN